MEIRRAAFRVALAMGSGQAFGAPPEDESRSPSEMPRTRPLDKDGIMFQRKSEEEIQAEIRRRVIAEADEKEEGEYADAGREALSEITSLSRAEVDRIARDVRGEIARESARRKKLALIVVLAFAAVVAIGVLWLMAQYNRMVSLDEEAKTAWSQVENVYQRRMDLIPNLVSVVRGYARHEQETLRMVIEARARAAGGVSGNPLENPEALERFQRSQSELGGALNRLMVVAERYPELRADQNFLALQAQLEGSENRIAVERRRFNETLQRYNRHIKRFPQVMIAGIFGFEPKSYFEAEKGADRPPEVRFD
jgi:LemA protein